MQAFRLGAQYLGDGRTSFLVWAPLAEEVAARLVGESERAIELTRVERGYFHAIAADISPGQRYFFRLRYSAGRSLERPDPASRLQPQGVHGPSEVVADDFAWTDAAWRNHALADYVIYELHVGTFSPERTFDGVVARLDKLVELGVTAVELMPVCEFPGDRNWGYDGVYPFAAHHDYGGPQGLKRLIDACHARGLAVLLDVVYNHLGPEGNYLSDFAPYFTDRYRTPWGQALNFDAPGSDEVRRFFIDNALQWIDDFHFDGLRLDAVHAIHDALSQPFLRELSIAVHQRADELGRPAYLFAESNLNNPIMVDLLERGGHGLDGVWLDDFHRALHALLTGERQGWYRDFGGVEDFAQAIRAGFVMSGQFCEYRGRRHGASSAHVEPRAFVASVQNHDQIGNRMLSDRLSQIVDFESLKLAAATVLLSPYIPLLFMGEEYGDPAPFNYFISHLDHKLVDAVRAGRQREFRAFGWTELPADPQAIETFTASAINAALQGSGRHAVLWALHQELLRLRKSLPAIGHATRDESQVIEFKEHPLIVCLRQHGDSAVAIFLHFGQTTDEAPFDFPPGQWRRVFDSADAHWKGPGSLAAEMISGLTSVRLPPRSCVAFVR